MIKCSHINICAESAFSPSQQQLNIINKCIGSGKERTLTLEGISLNKDATKSFFEIVPIEVLNMNSCFANDNQLQLVCDSLMNQTNLREILLATNNITSLGCSAIGRLLNKINCVEILDLSGNPIELGTIFDCLSSNKSLISLDMREVKLKATAYESLCNCLKTNQTLTSINISLNPASEKEGHFLKEAFRENFSITEFRITGNQFGIANEREICLGYI
ncbi:uncharacterized protein MONOS_10698 [Monocercomonoides exilis]|uniref:uncharacterized protein n=1 Tax=Monocercomonoides exilis TaxID=2049356 RepID=UPI003559626A|nr:hypothetical protein MONOS_10698 [Monocercomonoides exilis]|eukprot:MONOS_10698.1-p1 / transcript=MONOS_10698.1 / gene=MONOS_10698 / organism=Monocercomonoides_exilis_PA203 / gene_product=unspecified product / transcript_product=unspecified product / location=Mono_scaffold00496:32270-33317(+) / protein_length=219 / sequence_SO=supercontig / SO=protein_coding / is_pseudo=false